MQIELQTIEKVNAALSAKRDELMGWRFFAVRRGVFGFEKLRDDVNHTSMKGRPIRIRFTPEGAFSVPIST